MQPSSTFPMHHCRAVLQQQPTVIQWVNYDHLGKKDVLFGDGWHDGVCWSNHQDSPSQGASRHQSTHISLDPLPKNITFPWIMKTMVFNSICKIGLLRSLQMKCNKICSQEKNLSCPNPLHSSETNLPLYLHRQDDDSYFPCICSGRC